MERQSSGFTLVELVIVITILGILAAIALPKFAALQADARVAKMGGALASLKGAAAMAHGQLLARGFSATETISQSDMANKPADRRIVMEGTTVGFVNGYPAAAQIAEIAGVQSPDYYLPAVASGSQTVAPDADHDGSGGNPACTVVYQEATVSSGQGSPPTYANNATITTCQ